jgi:hypothetical protein
MLGVGRAGPRGQAHPRALTLHVTNGGIVVGTLAETGLGGEALSWDDTLQEGPVPRLPPEALREERARFLSACGWGDEQAIGDSLERRDGRLADALAGGRVVLWFEHDLYDQLQLLQILVRIAEAGADRVELIAVGSFPGRPDFHGLGELSPDELATLWSQRRPVTAAELELARAGWDAFRAAEPTAIESLLGGDTSALPFLAAAFRRLLEELPDSRDGLARSERQLLEALAEGPRTPAELFVAGQKREQAPSEGDTWVWRRLSLLGVGERPLVAAADGGALPTPPPLGEASFATAPLTLTDAGRAVLAGAADRVELLGIDRWLGGTHLRAGHVPRWDAAAARVV